MDAANNRLAPDGSLEQQAMAEIAKAALKTGRTLMECGASVSVIREGATLVGRGLGAESVGIRTGYASIAITLDTAGKAVTLMTPVGRHGVNHRLDMAVRAVAKSVGENGGSAAGVVSELDRVIRETPRYSPWVVAVATGAACAAFGRLLGIDWLAFLPVFAAGTIAQRLRHTLLVRGFNIFVVAALIAFLAGALGGLGAKYAGSGSVSMAMMASTLLLVPGVPATNAQTDIMEGYPTVGSARAVTVAMIMVFVACGVWCAEAVIRAAP